MYSVVLMMAMTTSVDTPDLGNRNSCGCGHARASHGCGHVAASCGCGHQRHHHGHRHHGCGHVAASCGCGYVAPACGCTGYAAPVAYGCAGYAAPAYGCAGGVIVAPAATTPKKEEGKKEEKKEGGKEASQSAPATIVVSLPADAKLTIDDAATTSTSAQRTFQSPELPAGRTFNYTLKAEFQHEGKPVVISKQVSIRAGEESRVTIGTADLTGVASR